MKYKLLTSSRNNYIVSIGGHQSWTYFTATDSVKDPPMVLNLSTSRAILARLNHTTIGQNVCGMPIKIVNSEI